MLLLNRSLKLSLLLGLVATLLLGGCSRMQVVPEENGSIETLPPPVVAPGIPVPAEPLPPVNMPSAPNTSGQVHIVQPKEGLYSIAKQYGLNYQTLAAWNGIPPPYLIHPGQVLRLTPPNGSVTMPAPVPVTVVTPVPTAPVSAPVNGARYHTVNAGETLYSIARQYSVSVQDLVIWNELPSPYTLSIGQSLMVSPAYNGNTIIVDGRAVPLIPADQWNPMNQPTVVVNQPMTTGGQVHIVQPQETLYGIARRYGVAIQDLAAWNGMSQPYPSLSIGQRLIISGTSSYIPPATPAISYTPPAISTPMNATQYHTVQKGETLFRLSRQYNVSVNQLASANSLRQPYALKVGQRLLIPGGSDGASYASAGMLSSSSVAFLPPPVKKATKLYHTVKKGESLATIAAMYGQNTQELALWNGIAPPYNIYVGQSLMVVQ